MANSARRVQQIGRALATAAAAPAPSSGGAALRKVLQQQVRLPCAPACARLRLRPPAARLPPAAQLTHNTVGGRAPGAFPAHTAGRH